MTKLNVIKKFNRTRLMRVALVLLMACFANDMFGQQLYVHYATRDNGKDIVIPSDKRTEAKYFSINGNTIYSYSYPLKMFGNRHISLVILMNTILFIIEWSQVMMRMTESIYMKMEILVCPLENIYFFIPPPMKAL